MVHGSWFIVQSSWFMVSGFWFKVHGFWWVDLGGFVRGDGFIIPLNLFSVLVWWLENLPSGG
jgi:hypothetical protein